MTQMSGKLASGRKEGLPDAVRNFIEDVYGLQRVDQMMVRSTGESSVTTSAIAGLILTAIETRDCDLANRLFAAFGSGQVGFVEGALKALLCDRPVTAYSTELAFSSGGGRQLLAVG